MSHSAISTSLGGAPPTICAPCSRRVRRRSSWPPGSVEAARRLLPGAVPAMAEAATRIVGTHDFEGFAAAGHGRTSTVRTIHACRVESGSDDPTVAIVVVGDGFLYNMVRIIAGTLVEVGRGRFVPSVVDDVLATGGRTAFSTFHSLVHHSALIGDKNFQIQKNINRQVDIKWYSFAKF